VSPLAEYRVRLDDRRRASQRLEKEFRRIGNARLAAAFAAVVVAFFVFGEVWISVWWLLLPLAVFGALVVVHARVVERLERSKRAIQFYERGSARLEDRWIGTGETGERFRNPSHVYSEDLDLFGKGSLFELLSTARTRAGEDFLASWLLAPASADEVTARHEAVRELRAMLDLREDLAVLGATVRSGLDPDAAAAWGEAPEVRFPPERVLLPQYSRPQWSFRSGSTWRASSLARPSWPYSSLSWATRSSLAPERCTLPPPSTRRLTIWHCWRNSFSAWNAKISAPRCFSNCKHD